MTSFRRLGILTFITLTAAHAADLVSGPAPGAALAPLQVYAATGPREGKELDYVAERGAKPTVFVLVREFDRPVARFLKALDTAVHEESAEAVVVAAWLTDQKDETKTYLPRVQQSLKMEHTALTVFLGDKNGPNDWDVSPDARVTVVVARDRKSAARIGFRSINETDVARVRADLKKALNAS